MTVGRNALLALFALSVTAAAARTPNQSDLQQQYVGQQWLLNYPSIPCSRQMAEVTALELLNEKAHTPKAPKGETLAIDPPGRKVTFTVRCPDGSSYSGKVALQYLDTILTKPSP